MIPVGDGIRRHETLFAAPRRADREPTGGCVEVTRFLIATRSVKLSSTQRRESHGRQILEGGNDCSSKKDHLFSLRHKMRMYTSLKHISNL